METGGFGSKTGEQLAKKDPPTTHPPPSQTGNPFQGGAKRVTHLQAYAHDES